jgi:hypothetical protein
VCVCTYIYIYIHIYPEGVHNYLVLLRLRRLAGGGCGLRPPPERDRPPPPPLDEAGTSPLRSSALPRVFLFCEASAASTLRLLAVPAVGIRRLVVAIRNGKSRPFFGFVFVFEAREERQEGRGCVRCVGWG